METETDGTKESSGGKSNNIFDKFNVIPSAKLLTFMRNNTFDMTGFANLTSQLSDISTVPSADPPTYPVLIQITPPKPFKRHLPQFLLLIHTGSVLSIPTPRLPYDISHTPTENLRLPSSWPRSLAA